MQLTDEERKAIASLKRLAKKWPKTLWIFSGGNGSPTILKTGEEGRRIVDRTGSIDQNYIVGEIDLPIEGGDW